MLAYQSYHTGIERKPYRLIVLSIGPTNRTILELKVICKLFTLRWKKPTNRTILELKVYVINRDAVPQIAYQSYHTGIESYFLHKLHSA